MSEQLVPAAVFGKPNEPGGRGGYRWLLAHTEVPDEARASADAWIRRFQWLGSERAQRPVAAWVPIDRGATLLRFLDDGEDDVGRSHTLQLELLWWSNPPKPLELAGLLHSATEPDRWVDGDGGRARLPAQPATEGATTALISRLESRDPVVVHREGTRFDLGGHYHAFRRLADGGWLEVEPSRPDPARIATTRRRTRGRLQAGALGLVALLLAGAGVGYHRGRLADAEARNAAQADRVRALTAQVEDKEAGLGALRAELEQAKAAFRAQLEVERRKLADSTAELEDARAIARALREDADPKTLERLDAMVERLSALEAEAGACRTKLDRIRAIAGAD